MPTRRERAWALLQQRAEGWTPRDLAEALDADERTVLEDLRHLQRSAKRSGLALLMAPATCQACGWAAEADAPRAPGRCPRCRATRVEAPRFRVAPK